MEYKMGTAPAEWKPAPRVCRCCLSEGCYKDISTEYYWLGEKEMYSQMLKECFDLTISLSEAAGNSRLICEVCITRLRDASNFKKQVINSEKRFAEHLRSGASLSVAEVQETPVLVDIKVEGVKDEAAISDDDPDPVDDDIGDPDYDESDDLPLKFEVQKKESMTELSFGDEIPALNTSETTIRKVSSRTKEKSALKKLKMNKKELTIKPVKASTSKKKDKEAKVKLKATKPGAKKGQKKRSESPKLVPHLADGPLVVETRKGYQKSAKSLTRDAMKLTATAILDNSTITPFRWFRNSFLCSFCEAKFLEFEQLRLHNRHHNARDAKQIYRKFKQEISLVNVDLVDARCRLCDYDIFAVEDFKLHLVVVHDMQLDLEQDGVLPFCLSKDTWVCVKCSKSFNNFLKLYEHMNKHYQKYICDMCGKGFMTATRLRKHNDSHATGTFDCNDCKQTFTSKNAKERHKIKVHSTGSRYQCPMCDLRFFEYYERMAHLSKVHNVKSTEYKCGHCDRVFPTSAKRSFHTRSVHLPQEKKFSCEFCPWKFVTHYELKRHMVRHTGEKIFQCEHCNKAYCRSKTLKYHLKSHTNERKFACPFCGQASIQKCSWKQHLRKHHPEMVTSILKHGDDAVKQFRTTV